QELHLVNERFNEEEEPTCFADSFIGEMRKREGKGEELGSFSHQQLRAACCDLWLNGFETTAITLRYAFIYLINHPRVQLKTQHEIDEKIGKRPVAMDDQKALHYCNAVIQEVLRMEPGSIGFSRQVSAPVNIAGYDIPIGTGVIPQLSLVNMDPKEYERPDYFCSERHLNDKGEFNKDPRLTPFSMGKRSCLGEGLARMELFIFFTTFLQQLTFASVTKIPPELKLTTSLAQAPVPYEVIMKGRE
ncbi:hypothetical protein PENTCL1PPCAC_8955, partial [Pristionchus entomophagus]